MKIKNTYVVEGTVIDLEKSYSSFGKVYYQGHISTARLSRVCDVLPFICNEDQRERIKTGEKARFYGQIRSKREETDSSQKSKLIQYIWVQDVLPCTGVDENQFYLIGSIVYSTFRTTPLTNQKILDMAIITRDTTERTSYLQCIAWGTTADMIKDLPNRTELFCGGRFQSREYTKKLEDGSFENRTAYELSVNYIKFEDKEKDNGKNNSKDSKYRLSKT